jgi:threo-3-hydroxy-L-aspartate ammonia-lyase
MNNLNPHRILNEHDSRQEPPINYDDVASAAERLRGVAHRTPVLTSKQINARVKADVFFKCENFQRTGSFKFRGAYNALSRLTDTEKKQGVVAFSSGNHAQAIALAASLFNIKVTIVMPSNAPAIKTAATREYGAEIRFYERATEDRESIAKQLADEHGLTIIPSFNHPHIMAGQGTAAKELFEEVGALDYLFVCVGGGGLISGSALSAKALSPSCQIIGVEPEAGNDAQQSLQAGRIVRIDVPKTIADGAQTQSVGTLTFPLIQTHVADIITVSDAQLKSEMRFFAERMKMVVEPTGCLAAAGALSDKIDLSGKRVGVIVSGGNVDPEFFGTCIQ